MNILVANLGSTSFKYRLYRFAGAAETLVTKGGYERVTDYDRAIADCLGALRSGGHITGASDLHGVGFKAVHGGDLTGCVAADEKVEAALRAFADLAPAHNPIYADGISRFRQKLPGVPLVAVFETAFYQWVPEYARRYAVPAAWHAAGVRRFGFHGASHKYVAERSAELLGRPDIAALTRHLYQDGPRIVPGAPLRVISCHLGGSSSITGILNGVAIGNSLGMSPQSGLPHNNRVGDLDAEALPYAMKTLRLSVEEAQRQLSKEGGLKGLAGGLSNDIRDLQAAAANGNTKAQLAIDVFVSEARRWIGGHFFQMNGADAIVFTAGIGENRAELRAAICANLDQLGIVLDAEKNATVRATEAVISAANSRVKVLVIPTNEELVVARETKRLLESARN